METKVVRCGVFEVTSEYVVLDDVQKNKIIPSNLPAGGELQRITAETQKNLFRAECIASYL
jgi:hypothetical protein